MTHDRHVGVLAFLALVGAPASAGAQIAGVPVIDNPHETFAGRVAVGLPFLLASRSSGEL